MSRKYMSLVLALLVISAASAVAAPGLAAGDPKLVDAVKKSDIKTVRALLHAKVDVNSASADGTTALHWAVDGDNLEIAKVLVAAGASAKSRNSYGITPLTIACINAEPAMVELLLKAGADPNTVFSEGEAAIMTAARTGNAEVVKLLLDAGANADAKEPTRADGHDVGCDRRACRGYAGPEVSRGGCQGQDGWWLRFHDVCNPRRAYRRREGTP